MGHPLKLDSGVGIGAENLVRIVGHPLLQTLRERLAHLILSIDPSAFFGTSTPGAPDVWVGGTPWEISMGKMPNGMDSQGVCDCELIREMRMEMKDETSRRRQLMRVLLEKDSGTIGDPEKVDSSVAHMLQVFLQPFG